MTTPDYHPKNANRTSKKFFTALIAIIAFSAVLLFQISYPCYKAQIKTLMGESYTVEDCEALRDFFNNYIGNHIFGGVLYEPRIPVGLDKPVPVGAPIVFYKNMELELNDSERFVADQIDKVTVVELSNMYNLATTDATDLGSNFYVIYYTVAEENQDADFVILFSDTGNAFIGVGGRYQNHGIYEIC